MDRVALSEALCCIRMDTLRAYAWRREDAEGQAHASTYLPIFLLVLGRESRFRRLPDGPQDEEGDVEV